MGSGSGTLTLREESVQTQCRFTGGALGNGSGTLTLQEESVQTQCPRVDWTPTSVGVGLVWYTCLTPSSPEGLFGPHTGRRLCRGVDRGGPEGPTTVGPEYFRRPSALRGGSWVLRVTRRGPSAGPRCPSHHGPLGHVSPRMSTGTLLSTHTERGCPTPTQGTQGPTPG